MLQWVGGLTIFFGFLGLFDPDWIGGGFFFSCIVLAIVWLDVRKYDPDDEKWND